MRGRSKAAPSTCEQRADQATDQRQENKAGAEGRDGGDRQILHPFALAMVGRRDEQNSEDGRNGSDCRQNRSSNELTSSDAPSRPDGRQERHQPCPHQHGRGKAEQHEGPVHRRGLVGNRRYHNPLGCAWTTPSSTVSSSAAARRASRRQFTSHVSTSTFWSSTEARAAPHRYRARATTPAIRRG